MKQHLISGRLSLAVAAGLVLFAISTQAQDVAVTGSLSFVQASNGIYDYTLTLKNTGSESVEGLWLGWVPGSFDIASPTDVGSNLGWASTVDGNSVQYGGSPSETLLAPGNSATFTFDSTSTPAEFMSETAGQSVAYGVDASQFAIEGDSLHSVEFSPSITPEPATALATAQFTDASVGGGEFKYTVTLENTGTTSIGTFWYAWVPGEDFMAVVPTNIVSPAGWNEKITGGGAGDGYAIQWKSTTDPLAAGQSLQFSFESTVKPSLMEKDSVFYHGTPVETSFVYTGAPFSDPGYQFVVSFVAPKTLRYTLLISATDTSPTVPQGTGYATMTVSPVGKAAMAGKLADGESFSVSGTTVTVTGTTQFVIDKSLTYPSVTVRNAKGSLAGTITFVTVTGTSDLSGTLGWMKPQQKRGAYSAAIDTNLDVIGSLYTPPGSGESVLPGFTNGTLVLSDTGTLSLSGATPLEKTVMLTSKNALVVTDPGGDKAKATITASTGVFKGSFLYPGQTKRTDFDGVLFQDQTIGGGFFVGPDGGGAVSLSP
jgi:hypothetical protein